MSNDSIVLELFGRVQKLEQKVKLLEEKLKKEQIVQREIGEEQAKQILKTRANSRDYVAERLQKENPKFSIRKGNRDEGSGLVLTKDNGKQLLLKYYYSKSFLDFPSSWHTVDINDIENDNFDIYVFNVSFQDEYFVFLFTKEELRLFVTNKKLNSATKYYFYFHIQSGSVVEVRDEEQDVSKYYERWNLPSQLA